jgi:hypothetical protein
MRVAIKENDYLNFKKEFLKNFKPGKS